MIFKSSQGDDILVDDEDYERLKHVKWSVRRSKRTKNSKERISIRNTKIGMSIARFIMKCPKNKVVDHINRDPFDNRKVNLRICTNAQNNANREMGNRKIKYRGVYKMRGIFMAQITIKRKTIYLGSSKDQLVCAKMYNEAALKYYKEFACLNKLD